MLKRILSTAFSSKSVGDTKHLAFDICKTLTERLNGRKGLILVGISGEPDSGRTGLSEELIRTILPDYDQIPKDEFGQFSHVNEDSLPISRIDIIAVRLQNPDFEVDGLKLPDRGICFVEHADNCPGLNYDIEIEVNFVREGRPVNVSDLEKLLWQEELTKHNTIDIEASLTKIWYSPGRYINVTVNDERTVASPEIA